MTSWVVMVPFDDAKVITADDPRVAAEKFLESYPHEISLGLTLWAVRSDCACEFALGVVQPVAEEAGKQSREKEPSA